MQHGKSRQIIIQKAATIAEYTESYIILHQRMTNVFYHVLNVSFIFARFQRFKRFLEFYITYIMRCEYAENELQRQ